MRRRKTASATAILLALAIVGCSSGDTAGDLAVEADMENPFFVEWDNPFGSPPFDQIVPAHYIPAYEKGMADHNAEIEAIVANPEPATFGSTIETTSLGPTPRS